MMAVSVQLKKGDPAISTRDRAKFGWLTIEGADLPYIVRDAREKFIPVKMVEKYLLSYYPTAYPKELEEKPPLVCHYIKQEEADLMNKCCSKKAGFKEEFVTTDPIVKLHDFLEFFGVVKKAYPNVTVGAKEIRNIVNYGWILVKDAMVPYVLRNDVRLAPLNVIRGAAQLLIGVPVETASATEVEVSCLNTMCQKVGLFFTFQKNTALADLKLISFYQPDCAIQDLPKENPMQFVQGSGPAQAKPKSVPPILSKAKKPASTSTPPLLKPMPVMRNAKAALPPAKTSQTSASLSLQALANMAKGQQGTSPNVVPGKVSPVHNSTPTSNPRSPTQQASVNSTDKTKAKECSAKIGQAEIKPMECFGKTISCLMRGRQNIPFALVEAVCRVYFPQVSLVEFIQCLEMDLAITLYVMKKSEEDAFIEFYGIPTKQLRCNQVVKLRDLRDRMQFLQKRFKSGATVTEASAMDQDVTETKSDDVVVCEENVDGSNAIEGHVPEIAEATLKNDSLARELFQGLEKMITGSNSEEQAESCDSNDGQNGGQERRGNKSLENAILRILSDKKQDTGDKKSNGVNSPIAEENSSNGNEVKSPGSTKSDDVTDNADSGAVCQVKSSSSKRKAVPRKCCPVEVKKVALDTDIEANQAENVNGFTEDSDLEEYS